MKKFFLTISFMVMIFFKLILILYFFISHFHIYSSEMPNEIKNFEEITFEDAASEYFNTAKKYQQETPEYNEWNAEGYRMFILEKISEIRKISTNKIKYDINENVKSCLLFYDGACNLYKKSSPKKYFFYEYCTCCDCCFELNTKNIKYAKAMEMNAKKNDISLLLFLNNYPEENKYDPVQSWEKVKNTKPSYEKYAIAKGSEMIFYTNRTEKNIDEVIKNWENVMKDDSLIESFGGEKANTWIAYKSFANRKIQTFNVLKNYLFANDENKNFQIDSLKDIYKKNYEKDLDTYRSTNNNVFKAFAYEAAALYNSGEIFEGFYYIPIKES